MSNEQTVPTISPEIRAIADAFKPVIAIEGGKLNPTPLPAVIEAQLPQGYTIADVKAIQTGVQNIARGLDVAIGEVSIDAMVQDTSLDTVYGKVKIGNETYNAAFDRTRNLPAGVGAGRKDVWGHMTSGMTPAGGSNKKAVVSHLQNLGAQMLNKG